MFLVILTETCRITKIRMISNFEIRFCFFSTETWSRKDAFSQWWCIQVRVIDQFQYVKMLTWWREITKKYRWFFFFWVFIPPSLVTKLELVYCSSLCRIIKHLYVKKVISCKRGNVRLHCGTSATILTVTLWEFVCPKRQLHHSLRRVIHL